MTSISSTTVTTHHKHHKVKSQVPADSALPVSPSADALSKTSGARDNSNVSGGRSGVSIDKLLSQVIDLLQKLQESSETASVAADDGDGDQDGGVEGMVADMDSNQDGMVTSAEFVASRPSDVSEEQAARLFQSYDTQNAGTLSVADLANALKKDLGSCPTDQPGGSNDLFAALDINSDGMVSRDELAAGLQKAQPARENDVTALLRLLGGKDANVSL